MPTILRIGSYRFFFFAGDRDEPAHIHVERGDDLAKFWLDPVRLQNSKGFSRQELNRILHLVQDNAVFMLRKWDEYFND
jgi:hypothetical protein